MQGKNSAWSDRGTLIDDAFFIRRRHKAKGNMIGSYLTPHNDVGLTTV